MIKLFHGKDSFESYHASKKFLKEKSLEITWPVQILNLDEVINLDEFFQIFENLGLFSDRTIVYGKRIFSNPILMEAVLKKLEIFEENILILWEDSKVDSRLKLYKALDSKASVNEFLEPKFYDVQRWLRNILKVKQINLPQILVEQLLDKYQTNKWQIFQHLIKIKDIYSDLNLKNTEDINFLLGVDPNGDIWKIVDYFGKKDIKNLILEYEKFSFFDPASQLMLNLMHRELVLIAKVKYAIQNRIPLSETKIPPFILKKLLEKEKNFSNIEIKDLLVRLLKIDSILKNYQIDERAIFLEFFCNLKKK